MEGMLRARVLYPAILFAINAMLTGRLFSIEYLDHLYSVEGSFIAITRVMLEHPHERLWWPWWNLGMPFENSYLPLLPAMSALTAKVAGWSPAHAYHAVVAFAYCAGAVTVYVLMLVITRSAGVALFAGLAHSLISPSALLIPLIRDDMGGPLSASRLRSLVYYGEGPHIVALAWWPVAIVLIWLALERRRPWLFAGGGVAAAAVVATNAFGGVAIVLGCICVVAARNKFRSDLLPIGVTGLAAYLVISPWLPPSMLMVVRENARAAATQSWQPLLCLLIAMVAIWWLSRRVTSAALRFCILYASLMSAIALLDGHFQIPVLSQGIRYHLEMEMALSMLALLTAARLPFRARRVLMAAVLLLAGLQARKYFTISQSLIRSVKIEQTIEYKTAVMMRDRMRGERVMVTGSPMLWFTAFTGVPQLYGGHEPFNPNWSTMVAAFTLFSGMNAGAQDAEICVLWLKALGAHAINVSGPASPEPYHVFSRNPKLFDGVLPVEWREGDDTIYRVPQRHRGLAHVVPAASLVKERPAHGLDVGQVRRYVDALNDTSLPAASFRWENSHRALIEAPLQPGQVVSVQTTYHPGWAADAQGVAQPVSADGLGMLVIAPVCSGDCRIVLEYDGGAEAKVLRWLRWLTLLAVTGWLTIQARSR